ncbi:hypothetical protein PybrP1_000711 [[Pythium] brassicae (nom. inval.)]|nr:hypothetical protein PybrP1_000711 [[Pythium] brassicae (nom. inval.)]
MALPPAAGDWAVWQMVDSLYPTGGFAHSLGLEAAVQERLVTSGGAPLARFLRSSLHQSANFALPIVFSMHSAALQTRGGDGSGEQQALLDAVLDVNARTTALFSNHVARKASLAQGAAMLRLALSTYGSAGSPDEQAHDAFAVLLAVRKESKRQQHPGVHHAVVFALVCALLGVDSDTCQRLFLFYGVRDVLSAATRLNLVGPFEAARVQFELRGLLERVFQAKKNRPLEDSYSSAPVLDLVQAMHDQLYTRIFNS